MSEEELIKDYENKLKRVFKDITVKVHTYEKEVTLKTGVHFAIHLGEEYFLIYRSIKSVNFKEDILKPIYEQYKWEIINTYINTDYYLRLMEE